MRAILQRVSRASVDVQGKRVGEITDGIMVLLGVTHTDTSQDVSWLANKILGLRLFEDDNRKMNRSVMDVNGSLLVVSQFTLYGRVDKGRRPGFDSAASPDMANTLYEEFVDYCRAYLPVATGVFGAKMKVNLENDGPVTLIVDTDHKKSFRLDR